MANRSFGASLEVDIDNDGQLQIKCHPMFAKELGKVCRDIADMARNIVRVEHSNAPAIGKLRRPTNPRKSGGTGRLRSSIQPYKGRSAHIRQVGPHLMVGTVSAGSSRAPYARFVHEGTRRHIIRARPGGVLAFVWTGRQSKPRDVKKLIPRQHLSLAGVKARKARRLGKYGYRSTRLRTNQADVYTDTVIDKLADRTVITDQVDHPGYKGHRFLNQAAAIVVGGRGGRINLPRRSMGQ